MRVYWSPRTRSTRALWMVEELGVPYERVHVDIRAEGERGDAGFRLASPMGKVPALEDGECRMSESGAICLYLADRYSVGELAPAADDPERGRFLYWMFYTPAVIEPAMSEKVHGVEGNRYSSGWGDFPTMIATLEQGLAPGPWLMGERFTAADVMVGSSVVFLRMFKMLPDSAPLNAYADRCLARPAYQRALAAEETA